MIEAGTLLQNRYRVEKQIGQGGMGAVFIATDERFGSTVAIKETLFLDEKFRKAFEREAKLLNSLKHPALPRVSDHFAEDNGQFLVMEYIEGDDLSEIMERDQKAFALHNVLNWIMQLLDALNYLHTQELPVIHRDIKPQNLKLTPRGQIVLLDFGLAKGNVTNPESATAAKSMFGYSRNYASIEQIQGSGTDPRSDLYALAATAYHLLTGVPPADALTRAMNVLTDKPDPLIPVHEVNAEIPESLSEVLYKVMALNANQRPNSAKEMRAMLTESEKNVAAGFKTNTQTPLATNIFTQKTKISAEPKQSDIKTETMDDNSSQVTVLKPLVTANSASEKPSRRGLAIGATALGAIVLAGSALSAFYIYKPDVFGSNSNQTDANIERITTIANTANENANANVNNVNENMNADWENTANKALEEMEIPLLETKKPDTKPETTPKPETKPTKTETVKEAEVEENPIEQPSPKPTPIQPKIPILRDKFPRFPGNVNQPRPIPQEEERRRRRRQRQQRPY